MKLSTPRDLDCLRPLFHQAENPRFGAIWQAWTSKIKSDSGNLLGWRAGQPRTFPERESITAGGPGSGTVDGSRQSLWDLLRLR